MLEVLEILLSLFLIRSPYANIIFTVAVIAATITSAFVVFFVWESDEWKKREDRFLKVASRNPPSSFKDIKGMKALSEEIAGFFQPVQSAMIESNNLLREGAMVPSIKRWAIDTRIRESREVYTSRREVSLPFLTPDFWPPAERTLSEALRFRLRQELRAKPQPR